MKNDEEREARKSHGGHGEDPDRARHARWTAQDIAVFQDVLNSLTELVVVYNLFDLSDARLGRMLFDFLSKTSYAGDAIVKGAEKMAVLDFGIPLEAADFSSTLFQAQEKEMGARIREKAEIVREALKLPRKKEKR